MKLTEHIDGYIETDVQTKEGRLKLMIDRSKNHDGYVYVVNVDIVITSLDKPINETLKNLYRMVPDEFLSATQTTTETPTTYINLRKPKSIVYDMEKTDDIIDLSGSVQSQFSGVYDLQFMDEFYNDNEKNHNKEVTVTVDILQWYNNVKTSVAQIHPHIKRLNLTNLKTHFIIKPEIPFHKKPFTYVVAGSGSPFKSSDEMDKYCEFLSAIVSDYGTTVDLRIS